MTSRWFTALCTLAVAAVASPSPAQEVFVGPAAHDVNVGLGPCCREHGTDVQFGVRGPPMGHWLGGEMRAYLLGSRDTSDGLDFGAVGLLLRYYSSGHRFYVQPGLGAAFTDGSSLRFQATPDRLYLGSRVLFEPEVHFGWQMSERMALEAGLTHLSHARIAGRQNPGTNMVGVRFVYRFGR
jgi:lipid A 3-O-deacylase